MVPSSDLLCVSDDGGGCNGVVIEGQCQQVCNAAGCAIADSVCFDNACAQPCPNGVALLTVSKEPDAARAMIRFMISPAAAPLLRKTHVEPAKP